MAQNPFKKFLQKNLEKCKNSQKMIENNRKLLKINLESAYRKNVENAKIAKK